MIFCRIVQSSVRSLVLCVLSGVRLLTSATVTSWTLSLPRSSTRRVWPGLSRTAPSSLPSTTAWSGWLNWWGQTLFLLPVTHQPFMFPLLWSSDLYPHTAQTCSDFMPFRLIVSRSKTSLWNGRLLNWRRSWRVVRPPPPPWCCLTTAWMRWWKDCAGRG